VRERSVNVGEKGNHGTERVEFYAPASRNQAKGIAKAASTDDAARLHTGIVPNIFFAGGFSTGFARVMHRISTRPRKPLTYNAECRPMTSRFRLVVAFVAGVGMLAIPQASAGATLFRVFFLDGTSVVSYGELARVADRVVFAMPVGGTIDEPRLHPVTLAAALVDWERTNRYAASARYQQYSERAESDYQRLTDEVAALLNDIALSTDRARALSLAEQARRTLLDWPRSRFGYRQDDIRDIVALIDGAIARLGGDAPRFELALVATAERVEIEPLAEMPTPLRQLQQLLRVLNMTTDVRDRIALLESALAFIGDAGSDLDAAVVAPIRKRLDTELRQERTIDTRYARMTQKLMTRATRAAANARIDDVQHALTRVAIEDEQLGRRRPEVVHALTASLRVQLDRARRLRLLLDQWSVRKSLFRDYQRAVASEILQLVKAQPSLDAIRKLEGPAPDRLDSLRLRLSGGASRLQRLRIPEYLRSTHDSLVGAWRFAESAANARSKAVLSGDLPTAWEASSAAAGSMMMLTRVQQELRDLLQPPTLP
jgi:hypothetical protein